MRKDEEGKERELGEGDKETDEIGEEGRKMRKEEEN